MTILNFDFDDDQMVPQANFGSNQEGGLLLHNSVDTLNTPTLVKPIPDFESLLTDLTEVNSFSSSWTTEADPIDLMYPMAETTEAYRVINDLDRHMQDQDMTFYDDTPATIVIKPEKVEEAEQQQLQQQQQQQQQQQLQQQTPVVYAQSPAELLQDEGLNDIDDVTKEIASVCDRLSIPVSPYQWSVEQVSRWAQWTLEQYNLPICYLYDLKIDGTTLCMLSQEEFSSRWPTFGQYLHAQLEVWKGAWYNIKAESSPTGMYEETPTYLNLEPAGPQTQTQIPTSTLHQQQQQQQQQHQEQQQQAQPAYITMTQPMTSPSPSPCQSMCGSDLMMSSISPSIPKPVLGNLGCSNLSPASSMDSVESFASSPASEVDFCDRAFSGASMHQPQEPRPEVTPSKQNIHLWQFLRELLIQQQNYGSAIRWLDRSKGIFKIEDSARVARLWGQRKNRPAMNYDKLSRSIRQYYKKGIIKKTDNSKRLVYQFCPQYRV